MKAAVLFLAALASASRLNTPQARAQSGCDCSKNFHLSLFELDSCPEGYADVSTFRDSVECDQIGCTQQDHNVQCQNVVFPDDK
ncbi:hypothetical protein ISF_03882 [Cordyceps fumosorosea ARSEF 2679]|uniref:Uncharacterized protein n=1 Tax=Cordyceps fumosorosea (strain ARSEF 2679) TaxID=1081104 RepID=A0A167YA01_CORFA|nr:hypothetical protein ISF_03882 [Cordyceps fumosorosea ARSEF 2679]OAA66044.1 hypothetical protein ISF_03882 [Cordyceps fumosorosea ARSEF 2679]